MTDDALAGKRLHHDSGCEAGRPAGDTYTVNGCDCALREIAKVREECAADMFKAGQMYGDLRNDEKETCEELQRVLGLLMDQDEKVAELTSENERLAQDKKDWIDRCYGAETKNERLKNDLADALDLKMGVGPTVLTALVTERDRLRTENERLKGEVDEYEQLAALMRKRERPFIELWRQETNKPDSLPDYGQFLGWLVQKLQQAEGERRIWFERAAELRAQLDALRPTHSCWGNCQRAEQAEATLARVTAGLTREAIVEILDAILALAHLALPKTEGEK